MSHQKEMSLQRRVPQQSLPGSVLKVLLNPKTGQITYDYDAVNQDDDLGKLFDIELNFMTNC